MLHALNVRKNQHGVMKKQHVRNGRMQHDLRPCCQDWPPTPHPHLPQRPDTPHLFHHIHLRGPCRRALQEHHQHRRQLLSLHQFSLLMSRFSTSESGDDAGLTTPLWLTWLVYHNPSS